jgi:hypothetical protein
MTARIPLPRGARLTTEMTAQLLGHKVNLTMDFNGSPFTVTGTLVDIREAGDGDLLVTVEEPSESSQLIVDPKFESGSGDWTAPE